MLFKHLEQEVHPHITLALHLSNLQKLNLNAEKLERADAITSQPRAFSVLQNRILYQVLNQTSKKIEEALKCFAGGGVLIWVPETNGVVAKIVNAMKRLHQKGTEVEVHLLFPFIPMPSCTTAEAIMDLWASLYYNLRIKHMYKALHSTRKPLNVFLLSMRIPDIVVKTCVVCVCK